MRRWTVVLLLALSLAIGATAAYASAPVTGSLGIRLVDAPTDARDDPRAAVAVVDDLTPGTVVQRRIEISNGTDAPMPVALYATGADIADGIFTGHDKGTTDEIAGWTSLDRTTVTLPPGGSAMPTVRIAVPADAATGERYGVVWAETSTGEDGGVQQLSRVGVRLYLSVSGGNPPPTAFTVTEMTASRAADGTASVTARVANTGGRAIDANGTLSLGDGPGGTSAGPFRASTIRTIAPGQADVVGFTLDAGLPDGPWAADVEVTSGLVTESATATLTFPAAGAAAAVATAPGGAPTPTEIGLVGAGGILFAAVVAGLILVERHRRQRDADRRPIGV